MADIRCCLMILLQFSCFHANSLEGCSSLTKSRAHVKQKPCPVLRLVATYVRNCNTCFRFCSLPVLQNFRSCGVHFRFLCSQRPLTNKDLQQIAWHLQDQRTVQILQQELRLRYYGISLDRPPSHFLVRWRAAQEDDVMAWHVLREVLIGCGMQHVVSTVLDRPSV